MKPLPELPASGSLLDPSGAAVPVGIVDVSVGGIALGMSSALRTAQLGQRFQLKLTLAHFGEYVYDAEVCWLSPVMVGMRFIAPPPPAAKCVGRYVAELLERGAPS